MAAGRCSAACRAALAIARAITNFLVAPIAIGNRVYINWKYTTVANDTSLFDVYRENVLIGSVSNVSNGLAQNYVFADLTGMPNANYIYKVVGYRIQNGTVWTKTLKDTLAFPIVATATSLAAAPNATLGTVNLTWANSSTNFVGYNLYRNSVLITSPLAGKDVTNCT